MDLSRPKRLRIQVILFVFCGYLSPVSMLLVGNWLLLRHFSFLILAAVAVATRILVFGPTSLLVVADLLFRVASLSDQPSEPSFGGL